MLYETSGFISNPLASKKNFSPWISNDMQILFNIFVESEQHACRFKSVLNFDLKSITGNPLELGMWLTVQRLSLMYST